MTFCPNCSAELKTPGPDSCWNCSASFGSGSVWKPTEQPSGEFRVVHKAPLKTESQKEESPNRLIFRLGLQAFWSALLITFFYFVVMMMAFREYGTIVNGVTSSSLLSSLVIAALTAPFAGVVGDATIDAVAAQLLDTAYGVSASDAAFLKARIYVGTVGVFAVALIHQAFAARREWTTINRGKQVLQRESAAPKRPWERW